MTYGVAEVIDQALAIIFELFVEQLENFLCLLALFHHRLRRHHLLLFQLGSKIFLGCIQIAHLLLDIVNLIGQTKDTLVRFLSPRLKLVHQGIELATGHLISLVLDALLIPILLYQLVFETLFFFSLSVDSLIFKCNDLAP